MSLGLLWQRYECYYKGLDKLQSFGVVVVIIDNQNAGVEGKEYSR